MARSKRLEDKAESVKGGAQFADESQRLRIVAVNAQRANALFTEQPFRLTHRLGGGGDKGVGRRARRERTVGKVSAVGESFGDKPTAAATQRLQPRSG